MEKSVQSDRDILLVAVFTFLTVFIWVFFELVKTAKTSTVSSTVRQTVKTFSPVIDMATLESLSKRPQY